MTAPIPLSQPRQTPAAVQEAEELLRATAADLPGIAWGDVARFQGMPSVGGEVGPLHVYVILDVLNDVLQSTTCGVKLGGRSGVILSTVTRECVAMTPTSHNLHRDICSVMSSTMLMTKRCEETARSFLDSSAQLAVPR